MALRRLPQGDTQWEPPLMVLNSSWQADALFGGSIFAQAVGGTAPFSWVQRCGPVDLSNAFPKFDALGGPFDPRTPTFWIRFG